MTIILVLVELEGLRTGNFVNIIDGSG